MCVCLCVFVCGCVVCMCEICVWEDRGIGCIVCALVCTNWLCDTCTCVCVCVYMCMGRGKWLHDTPVNKCVSVVCM